MKATKTLDDANNRIGTEIVFLSAMHFGPGAGATNAVARQSSWRISPHLPAKLHIYAGGHGFGLRANDHPKPAGKRIERFEEWLADSGFLKKP